MFEKEPQRTSMPRTVKNRTPFAQRLSSLRKSRGLTQEELAQSSGVSRRVIAHYETNIKAPTADVALRLAKTLDISLTQLMGQRPISSKPGIDRTILRKAKLLEKLTVEDKKTVIRMIDSLTKKNPRR